MNTKVLPGINDGPNVAESSLKDKKSVSPDLDTEIVGNERGLIMLETNSKDEIVNCSRPATMLRMALGDDARRKPTPYSRLALAQATFLPLSYWHDTQI